MLQSFTTSDHIITNSSNFRLENISALNLKNWNHAFPKKLCTARSFISWWVEHPITYCHFFLWSIVVLLCCKYIYLHRYLAMWYQLVLMNLIWFMGVSLLLWKQQSWDNRLRVHPRPKHPPYHLRDRNVSGFVVAGEDRRHILNWVVGHHSVACSWSEVPLTVFGLLECIQKDDSFCKEAIHYRACNIFRLPWVWDIPFEAHSKFSSSVKVCTCVVSMWCLIYTRYPRLLHFSFL